MGETSLSQRGFPHTPFQRTLNRWILFGALWFAHSRPKCVAFWARESKKDMKKKTSFLFHILFSFLAPIVAFGNA